LLTVDDATITNTGISDTGIPDAGAQDLSIRPIVTVDGLVFGYGEESPIFDEFRWSVQPGEMWSILGPSGCGKTTLLYLLSGLQQANAGTILVNDLPAIRPRASTGLILQDHGLLPWSTVQANAALGLRIGKLYRNKAGVEGQARPYPPNLPPSEADGWLERLGIAHLADKYPTQLSGGQRQRVAIARTLSLRPDLLLMDEPFSALDIVIRENLQDLVVDIQAELGVTTIIVTHSVDEAAYLGRKILVLSSPPNREAMVIDNPRAGQSGYRGTDTYQKITSELRRHLDEERA
jgi:ABC-type nitrate/sulfonate/bicarbonate transport system ATPase subunit